MICNGGICHSNSSLLCNNTHFIQAKKIFNVPFFNQQKATAVEANIFSKYANSDFWVWQHLALFFNFLHFLTTFPLRMLCLKKPWNMSFFKKFKTKILIFFIFSKSYPRNELHAPFLYPISIPSTAYVKIFILFVGGPRGSRTLKNNLTISKNYFN